MNKSVYQAMDESIDIINKTPIVYMSSHINPDGDSIGSMLGLALGLIKKGKKVVLVKNDSLPSDYLFLPGIELIQSLDKIPEHVDVFISLDSSDLDRLGDSKDLFNIASKIINIDHHISNTNFGDINIVQPHASATGEIVYELLTKMNIEIDKEIAENLYTAISTDTGSFKYDSVSAITHSIISELIKTGMNTSKINIMLYESVSIERTRLLIESLNSMNIYYKGKLAIVRVTQDMLSKTKTSLDDTEGIVSFIRKMQGIEVACLLKELQNEEVKVSIRSKEYVDVSQLCTSLGGGGHIRAAGCTIYSNIDKAESIIVESLLDKLR